MSEEIVKLPSFAYQKIYGALGIQNKSQITWERCRDRFQANSEGIKEFLFYHNDNAGEDVIQFIRTVEQIVDLPAEHALTIKRTTNPNVLLIGLTDWWRYRVRRSLLTALLRCGQRYSTHTGAGFQAALNSEYYTAGTKSAIDRFLAGHTTVKGMKRVSHFPGWYQFFSVKTPNQIEQCLIKLKKKKKKKEGPPTFLGDGI